MLRLFDPWPRTQMTSEISETGVSWTCQENELKQFIIWITDVVCLKFFCSCSSAASVRQYLSPRNCVIRWWFDCRADGVSLAMANLKRCLLSGVLWTGCNVRCHINFYRGFPGFYCKCCGVGLFGVEPLVFQAAHFLSGASVEWHFSSSRIEC